MKVVYFQRWQLEVKICHLGLALALRGLLGTKMNLKLAYVGSKLAHVGISWLQVGPSCLAWFHILFFGPRGNFAETSRAFSSAKLVNLARASRHPW